MIAFSELPELSLYIHLPWCLRKCPYCDFNSHEQRDALPESAYIEALMRDLESWLPMVWGRPVVTIFFGGGTPSLFSPDAIDRILSGVRSRIKVLPQAEITLEANPGTFEAARFRGFREAGITRLSIGVQSFSDVQLLRLGRVHDSRQALEAVTHALETFERVNVDLMFGLPEQTIDEAALDLDQALRLGVGHVSCYQLTLEPGTRFAARPPDGLPDEDTLAQMHVRLTEQMQSAGLARYEVSAYARDGHHCRHNLNYWSFGDYLGIGAGAHGKISSAGEIVRTARARHPLGYLEDPTANTKITSVAVDDLPFEFMLNALRLIRGVPVARWSQTTGMAIGGHPFLLDRLSRAQRLGLMAHDPASFRSTPRGLELLNDLQSLFLP
jgi:putative oxygen-independent coproporphyrinogen III oxidase